jgi:hypothetical protein
MPNWLLQSLASRLVWEILLMLGVGAVLAYLKKKIPEYADRALFGLVAATCIAILWFTFTGEPIFSTRQPEPTPDNVEGFIKNWASSAAVSIMEVPNPSEAFFGLEIAELSGQRFRIERPRVRDDMLRFVGTVTVPESEKQLLEKLPKNELDRMRWQVSLELARSNSCEFNIDLPQQITVSRYASIAHLTSDELGRNIQNIGNCIVIAIDTVKLSTPTTKETNPYPIPSK